MTLSIMTVSTMTLSMKDLYVTLTYFTTVVSYARKMYINAQYEGLTCDTQHNYNLLLS
jgi:hypothetical protein